MTAGATPGEPLPELARRAVHHPQTWRDGLQDALLAWYRTNGRSLPWRGTLDPYRIWLSEVMLQQTQVERVIPYYHRFLQRFPDLAAFAAAAESEVLKAWEGLGFYRRVRLFHQAARELAREGGQIPADPGRFRRLPGVGDYTAGAVLSIAFGCRLPAVDGNAFRVLSRWSGQAGARDEPAARRQVEALAAWLVPAGAPGDWNQAIMDLGSLICLPGRRVRCGACPVARLCQARARGVAAQIPAPGRRSTVQERLLFLGLLRAEGRVLVRQRPPEGLLAGFWELPGVELAADQPAGPEVLARQLGAWLGTKLRVAGRRLSYTHRFSHRLWRVELWEVLPEAGGAPSLPDSGSQRLAWVEADQLGALPVAAAHRPAMELAAQEQADAHQQDEQPLQGEEARPQAPPVPGKADPEREEAGTEAGHGQQEAREGP